MMIIILWPSSHDGKRSRDGRDHWRRGACKGPARQAAAVPAHAPHVGHRLGGGGRWRAVDLDADDLRKHRRRLCRCRLDVGCSPVARPRRRRAGAGQSDGAHRAAAGTYRSRGVRCAGGLGPGGARGCAGRRPVGRGGAWQPQRRGAAVDRAGDRGQDRDPFRARAIGTRRRRSPALRRAGRDGGGGETRGGHLLRRRGHIGAGCGACPRPSDGVAGERRRDGGQAARSRRGPRAPGPPAPPPPPRSGRRSTASSATAECNRAITCSRAPGS